VADGVPQSITGIELLTASCVIIFSDILTLDKPLGISREEARKQMEYRLGAQTERIKGINRIACGVVIN